MQVDSSSDNDVSTSSAQAEAVRRHLEDVLKGQMFRGSPRAGQFLRYLVENAVQQNTDALRERSIGIALFGRPPGFDTSSDAIVRVTASDVRRRLKEHYERHGSDSGCRFSLPPGTYVPEIDLQVPVGGEGARSSERSFDAASTQPASEVSPSISFYVKWAGAVLIVFNLAIWWFVGRSLTAPQRYAELPWKVILEPPRTTQIVTSDPNIAEIQRYTGGQISLSDYANRIYVPHPEKLTPDQLRLTRTELRGDKAALVDLPIALSIAERAARASIGISIRGARDMQIADLKRDDNYILLGSPRSNPWVNLYNERLDFRFAYDMNTGREMIRNFKPLPGERTDYISTAPGWATGESFAVVALVPNQDQAGRVLLIAGETAEGTEAAGQLLNDPGRFRNAFHRLCKAKTTEENDFELLLHLSAVAGSSGKVETIACHIL